MSTAAAQPEHLSFLSPPPGLEPHTDFVLAPIAGAEGLYSLTANAGTARLFLLDPAVYLTDYTPKLPAADLNALGAGPAWVLVVVNPGANSTANLAAPIVVNRATGACTQLILDDTTWPLRHALSPK